MLFTLKVAIKSPPPSIIDLKLIQNFLKIFVPHSVHHDNQRTMVMTSTRTRHLSHLVIAETKKIVQLCQCWLQDVKIEVDHGIFWNERLTVFNNNMVTSSNPHITLGPRSIQKMQKPSFILKTTKLIFAWFTSTREIL